ncbi:MAG: amino acid-binding protein [Desulfobacterales bacterium]|nr:amino acid-binding protein [Desulfobacterales bacterium]MBF0398013.1 amino acid-binding protein [Desulfobacterales bacterium]
MPITQISIAVENKPGKLHEVCEILEKEHINIKGIMSSTKLEPVQLHMIVDDPDKALNVFNNKGYITASKEVIAVSAPDHPGGLNAVLRTLLEKQVNVETLYPFIKLSGGEAILILEVDKIIEAKEILKKHWIKTYGPEIYKM